MCHDIPATTAPPLLSTLTPEDSPLHLLLPLALAANPPDFDVQRGWQDAPFSLTLTAQDSDDEIFFDRGPGTASQAYGAPIDVDTSAIVRAWTVDSAGEVSPVDVHTYLFMDQILGAAEMDSRIVDDPVYGPDLAASLAALPILSVVSDIALDLTERPVSFEWVEPGGESLSIQAGAKKVGNASVNYAKFNIRLYFRATYGPTKLDLDIYPDHATGVPPADTHDALNLRSGSHDSVFYLASQAQYLRNRWMDESQLEMGHIAPHGRSGHAFLNGVYAGVYHVRERFNAAFLAEYLGGDEDDYEAVNGGNVIDGTGTAWSQVNALAGDYEGVRAWLDVENLLDYLILNYYAANAWDWLYYHNWMGAGPSEPDRGGYVFHSSDSDICLVYDHTTDILHLGGPNNLFHGLMGQAHPDFMVLLADRIQAHLGPGGVLTADAAAARYDRLAQANEEAMAAETARWGSGWWERDDEWDTERARLMNDFFPYRTDSLMDQFVRAGWFPVPAPELTLPDGLVPVGSTTTVQVPVGVDAELWVRVDGGDPRLPGGELAAEAMGPARVQALTIDQSTLVRARLRQGAQWGPIVDAFFEVDQAPAIVLNEWNAVVEDRYLDDGDDALGDLPGNGGDWLEFVVLEDGLDLRGWVLTLTHRNGPAGTLTFQDHDVLASLAAGTLLTVAEDLPEDLAVDPQGGDWRFHLRAGVDGTGQAISAEAFDVTHREWQLVLQDADGFVRFGPVGEGIGSFDGGLSGSEVGLLAETPGSGLRRASAAYVDGDRSSFGAANVWGDQVQDLDALRDLGEPPVRRDTGDTGGDTAGDTGVGIDAGCGCAAAPGPGAGVAGLALLALGWRRRAAPALAVVAVACGEPAVDSAPDVVIACYPDADQDGFGDAAALPADCAEGGVRDAGDCDDTDPWVNPAAIEVCGGGDEDCDGLVDDDDPDVADPLAFYEDADQDGYGGAAVAACVLADGLTTVGGDCDDDDATLNPGAAELCDDIDQDCDGHADDALGASAECPLASCLEALAIFGTGADDAYWLTLDSGGSTQVWCDLTTDGGGWTLGFLRSSAGGGDQPEFGVGDVGVDALAVSPVLATLDAVPRMGWVDLNTRDWTELQISAAQAGAETWRSENIPREHLRLDFGEPGYLLYGGESPYYWCGGPASYTDSGVGQVDQPAGAYADCKGHGSVGSGWDFSTSTYANQGLTLCGSDGSAVMHATWAGPWVYYGTPGAAQGLWVR